MCLAIFKPGGVSVPIENLSTGWINNPDGGGYAFIKDGKVVIRKGFMKLKDYLAAYNTDLHDEPNSPFLLHFRIRTYGEKNGDNTHPFQIEGGALIHNGSMSGTGAVYNTGWSDTYLFANKFSKDLNFDFVLNNKKDLESALVGNRIAVMYDDGSYNIINENEGQWHDGVWYSNSGFKSSAWNNHGMHDFDWE